MERFTVKKQFTDAAGKTWDAGATYTSNDPNEIEQHRQAGDIVAQSQPQGQPPRQ